MTTSASLVFFSRLIFFVEVVVEEEVEELERLDIFFCPTTVPLTFSYGCLFSSLN